MDINKSPQSHLHHQPGTLNEGAHYGNSDSTSDSDKSDDEVSDHNDNLTSLNSSSLRKKISSEVNLQYLLFFVCIPPKSFFESSIHSGHTVQVPSEMLPAMKSSIWVILVISST